jgi:hypothetical protein
MHVTGDARIEGGSNQWAGSELNVDGNLVLAGTMHLVGNAQVLGDLDIDTIAALDGTGGICVGGNSRNAGTVSEIYFCDATGSDFDLNTGTIAPDVVYCTNSVCALGIDEHFVVLSVFPNPASEDFSVAAGIPVESVELYALTGERVRTVAGSEMTVEDVAPGVYLVGINGNASGWRRVIVR